MINLSEIYKKIDAQDMIRRNLMVNPPKYEPGFEEESKDNSKVWLEDENLKRFIDNRE